MVALFAGLVLLTVRKESVESAVVHAGSPTPASNTGARHSRTFSQAYEICAEDSEGRPLVVRQKKPVFFFPNSPPEVNDRTFIETEERR